MKNLMSIVAVGSFVLLAAGFASAGQSEDDANARVRMEGRKIVWSQPEAKPQALTGHSVQEQTTEPRLRPQGRAGYALR